MKDLLNNIEFELISGNLEDNINEVVIDSSVANKTSLFVCLNGVYVDGHDFIKDAYDQGCRNFVVEKDIDLKDANVVKVSDTRKSLSIIAQNFYNHPDKDLITIAITGTKGKTTTASLIKNIIESTGVKCGMIGTLGVFIDDEHIKTMNTTPESLDIQSYFRQMVDAGCKAVVMEVSSQALKVGRVEGLAFDYGIFTNLSVDHIGENEHKDYKEYRECKAKLFQMCKIGIFNSDDKEYFNMIKNCTCKIRSFGIDKVADYQVSSYNFLDSDGKIGMDFMVHYKNNDFDYSIYMPGKFSIYNALGAISLADTLGVPHDLIGKTLKEFQVKGRVEAVNISDDFTLLIDYAHEAMSLESLLKAIGEYNPKRIVTLFGCGGNRSKLRRYEMGEVSGKYSDLTIITEDNSRYENVFDIIEDIKSGICKTTGNYVAIPNRKDAIKYAIEHHQEGDIILLCGKGHEDYQEINGVRTHMDERELIKEIVEELKLEGKSKVLK